MPNRIENKQVWNQQPQLQVKDQMLCTAAPWRGPSATAIRFLPGVLWKNGLTIGENQPEILLFTIWNFRGAFFPTGWFSLGNATSTMSQLKAPRHPPGVPLDSMRRAAVSKFSWHHITTGHDWLAEVERIRWRSLKFQQKRRNGTMIYRNSGISVLFDVNYGRRWA